MEGPISFWGYKEQESNLILPEHDDDELFLFWPDSSQWAMTSSFTRFLDHTQWRTTVGRTPLDEWSARRRDLYLVTHNTHNRQTSMPAVGFEPTVSAGERPRTYALDGAATGTGFIQIITHWKLDALLLKISVVCSSSNVPPKTN